jgi:putative endonuclease
LSSRDKGNIYESIACNYLLGIGYVICDRNLSTKVGEIDILAKKEKILVLVEVKGKSSCQFGHPLEFITKGKLLKIKRTYNLLLSQGALPEHDMVRVDLVYFKPNSECVHIVGDDWIL